MAKISKCENCGAELVFSIKDKSLVCKNCGSKFAVNVPSGAVKRHLYSIEYNVEGNRKEETQYFCPACGSSIMAGREKPVNICASCGNTHLEHKTNSVVVPDGIVPFEISKDRAGELFLNFVKTRKFAPSDLAHLARTKKVIGLYSPVWKFDFEAHTSYRYVGIKKYVEKDGEDFVERTKRYPTEKEKIERFDNYLISGNKRIDKKILDEIGNYDYQKAIPYSTEYIQGFYLTDTNKDIHREYDEVTDKLISGYKTKYEERARQDYDTIKGFSCTTNIVEPVFNYLAVPIWANHYSYKGKDYHCYINGQTGKTTGTAPKSFWKILGLIGGIALGVGLAVLLLIKLL